MFYILANIVAVNVYFLFITVYPDSSEEESVLSQLDDKLINKRIDDGNSNLTNSQNVTNSTTDMKEEKTN